MNQHSDPIDFLIEFAWANGAAKFVVNNAKDELRRLREDNLLLDQMLKKPVAYGQINERYDLYNLRICDNPFNEDSKVVPLYSNKKEFLAIDWKGYHFNYGKLS